MSRRMAVKVRDSTAVAGPGPKGPTMERRRAGGGAKAYRQRSEHEGRSSGGVEPSAAWASRMSRATGTAMAMAMEQRAAVQPCSRAATQSPVDRQWAAFRPPSRLPWAGMGRAWDPRALHTLRALPPAWLSTRPTCSVRSFPRAGVSDRLRASGSERAQMSLFTPTLDPCPTRCRGPAVCDIRLE